MNRKSKSSKKSMVCIQKGKYSDINIDSLIKPLGGLKQFINHDERVLLKVNLLNASVPENAIDLEVLR